MKTVKSVSVASFALSLALALIGPVVAHAATTPSLGQTTGYGVLSNTYTNPTGPTTISGSVGFTTGPAVAPLGTHSNYGSGSPYSTAGIDQGTAWANLNAQYLASCTSLGAGAVNLDNVAGHVTGIYTPGCYSSGGAMNITTGQTVTLSGDGTYIFRPNGALTTEANTTITLTGASACDVFWIPTAATTLGANTDFKGTVIDDAGITIGDAVAWIGRALSFASTVATPATNASITVPSTCSTAPSSGGGQKFGNINVVKTVINDSGGTKTVADFSLFVNTTPVVSGVTNVFPAPASVYTVTETGNANYTQSFSGACDSDGRLTLNPGDNKFCIITNDDIGTPAAAVPPLIDVVKTASPLSLPGGSGPVAYTYTLRNIGTVPVTDITMVGDTCSPIIFSSGDVNSNKKLEVNETWVYRCSTTLSATHTNTVVATGWANGISATDIASATVVVGAPIVPPIIHIVKKPSTFLLSAPGGAVTYTYTVTNPGTAPLSNVNITDNKCTGLPGRVVGHPGDVNKNNLLESTESWTFTCKTNLTQTTTNVGTVQGTANGLTATDFALATVIVAAPKLPNTGFPPQWMLSPRNTILLLSLLVLVLGSFLVIRKGRSS